MYLTQTFDYAILSPGELYGGVERQIVDLCSEYLSLGQAVKVYLFHKKELASRLEAIGIIPVILSGHKYSIANANDFVSEIKNNNIKVVHAHGYRAMITCSMARRKIDFAVVKTEHGLPEKSGNNILRDLRSFINHNLDLWATNKSSNSVCYVTDDILKKYNGKHRLNNRTVIYNGINPINFEDFTKPESFDLSKNNIVIVGRVSDVKGINYAIEAMKSPMMPENTILHIVGDGPLLESHRRTAGNLSNIIFHGFRRDALNFIAHADALLMPSLHEGLPYTLLESMSLGTPVIVSAVGGMAEIIDDRVTGLLMPSKSSKAIVEACSTVLGDEQFARTLSENAAKLQREKFTLDQMAESYLKVYSDVSR